MKYSNIGISPISDDGMSRNYTFSAWQIGKVALTINVVRCRLILFIENKSVANYFRNILKIITKSLVVYKYVVYLCNKSKKMTNAIQTKKGQITEVPFEYQKEEGCVAFQKIEMTYFFYGSKMTDTFDTKILANGDQIVISGNGFIKDGFKIN